jgi:glycosyltransferase involved in cell wall biosynthesis
VRIAIDARLINESGVGRYIRNLLENLAQTDTKNEYLVLLKKRDLNRFKFGKNFKEVEADFNWYSMSEQLKLPKLLNSLKPDLVHFPHFNVPVFYKGKFVVTIHDLIHQHFTMNRATTLDPITYKVKQFGYRRVFDFALKKSKKIMVPSQYVKSQLKDEWGIDNGKVEVTTEGVDDSILQIRKKRDKKFQLKLLSKIRVTGNYIFYVGNAHPHKNIECLIEAFRKLKTEFEDLKLVLSGADHYFWKRIKNKYKDSDIIYTGFVTDEVLVALLSNARAFVMPSLEEGFGIPVLEAFACGCPVVCSGIGSLKEIGQDACIYFDPKNTGQMAEKIKEVLLNEMLGQELIKKGENRVKDFSWKKMAEMTLDIYLESGKV